MTDFTPAKCRSLSGEVLVPLFPLAILLAASGVCFYLGSESPLGIVTAVCVALAAGWLFLLLVRESEKGRRTRTLLHTVLESIPGCSILTLDRCGVIRAANRQTQSVFGYEPHELVGQSITLLLPTSSLLDQEVAGSKNELFTTTWNGMVELDARRKDGSEIVVEIIPSALLPGDAMFFLVRDITGRKRTYDSLRQREAHLRLITEQMPAFLWTTDAKLNFTSSMGSSLPWQDVRDSGAIRLTSLPNLEDVRAAEQRALQGESVSLEVWWRNSAFQVCIEPLRGLQREIIGTVGIAVDITDRKVIEEALRESEGRLRLILQTASDAIITSDADGNIVGWNESATRIFGLEEAEARGRPLATLIAERCRPAHQAAVTRLLRGVRPRSVGEAVELYGLRRDGREFPIELSVAKWETEKGVFVSSIVRDVTQRKVLEEQFRQAQKMEAIGQLAGGIAHDFNNLLCMINGYSEVLLRALPPDNPHREMVTEIHRAGERAANLTRQLLTFSRRQAASPVVLDVNVAVEETKKMLARMIGEHITLELALDPAPCLVKADPGHITQVLMNLAINARDAMPRGGQLTIRTRNVVVGRRSHPQRPPVAAGRYVLWEVADTGCGMTPEVKARMFEPFFTTKEFGKGTGLGLATVYGIVKQSGGHIEAESQPGKGTTVRIYLPAASSEIAGPSTESPGDLRSLRNETILLVEDDDNVRKLAERVLESHGYVVLDACNAQEALAIARQHDGPIALLLADVVLPDRGGVDLAKDISRLYPGIRVLFTSGYSDSLLVQHGVEIPRTPLLRKPYTMNSLLQCVRSALDRKAPTLCEARPVGTSA